MGVFYSFEKKNKKINLDEFLDLYEKIYFFENPDLDLEEKIEKILEKRKKSSKPLSREDIETIFGWKMDTKNIVNGQIKRRQIVDVGKVKVCIDNNKSYKSKEEAIQLLNELRTSKNNIGSVYAITVLYFLSGGEYPIYDRFVQIAVNAICSNAKIGDEVECKGLSDSPCGKTLLDSYEKKYHEKLRSIFKGVPLDRKTDRALWAYGHLFKEKK
ncbi:MAG: hypothetical protein K2J80_05490 [Oscillospiraceae bacterium]|nr:hypothetical protein [Oscillospiraceae bacterium]